MFTEYKWGRIEHDDTPDAIKYFGRGKAFTVCNRFEYVLDTRSHKEAIRFFLDKFTGPFSDEKEQVIRQSFDDKFLNSKLSQLEFLTAYKRDPWFLNPKTVSYSYVDGNVFNLKLKNIRIRPQIGRGLSKLMQTEDIRKIIAKMNGGAAHLNRPGPGLELNCLIDSAKTEQANGARTLLEYRMYYIKTGTSHPNDPDRHYSAEDILTLIRNRKRQDIEVRESP